MILTKWKKYGKSIQNKDLSVGLIGNGEKNIIIIAGMHGDEPQGKYVSMKLLSYYEENRLALQNKQLIFVTECNPDGLQRNTRGNANGVDLNRNFATKNWEHSKAKDEFYSGDKPASEPETIFISNLIEEYQPELIITLHQPYKVINYDGPAEEIASLMSKYNNYKIVKDIGYPTPGSLGNYAGVERGIPIITLELPESESDEKVWKDNKLGLIASINNI